MAETDVLSIPITGDGGGSKRVLVHFPSGLAVTDIQGFWDVAAPELNAMTNGVIGTAQVTFNLTNVGGLRTDPVADQFVRRGALLSFDPAATKFAYGQFIPAINPALVTGGQILVTDPIFTAWRDRILLGEAGPPVRLPSDEYANDITGLNGASLRFRK